VGLGIEGITAAITGQEFDPTRAASAAGSAAVGARASRRGVPPRRTSEPTTRLGRAAERFRSFDPGGIGAGAAKRLESLGGRLGGARPAGEHPGGVRAPTDQAPGRPIESPEGARTRTTEGPAPGRPPAEEGVAGSPRRPDESTGANEARAREVSEMRADTDLAAPGATRRIQIGDGPLHTVSAKRTDAGEVVLTSCSNCQMLRDRLKALANVLPDGPAKTRAQELANDAADLQRRINEGQVNDIAGETRAIAGRVADAADTHPDLAWALRNFLEDVTVQPLPPIAPAPGGRIDAGTEADFTRATGGTGRSGWFEPENAFSKTARDNPQRMLKAAWDWYQTAKKTTARPALGEFKEAEAAVIKRAEERAADPATAAPELYQLKVPMKDWQFQVNDAWLAAHIERGSTFEIVSNPTRKSFLETILFREKSDRVQSVFGRELQILERHGYRFVQDQGPKDPNSTRGIKGRMVPPSEVSTLRQQGYEWFPYHTPEGQFQGITGRWVRPASPAPRPSRPRTPQPQNE
jgi:hypothetical protein